MILTGPPGSGKTVMITEALKIKVAECRQERIPFKLIIATYSEGGCYQLRKDLMKKYNLECILDRLHVEVKSMEELSHGNKDIVQYLCLPNSFDHYRIWFPFHLQQISLMLLFEITDYS